MTSEETLNCICELLSKYAGEHGENEGAVSCLQRILKELETYRATIPFMEKFD